MSGDRIVELIDCSAFRQTIESRPPAIVHGAAILLFSLLAAAVIWSGCTRANLVVRAPGRVRPIDAPLQIFAPDGENPEGRIAAVGAREGDIVRRGEVLLNLDTARLDNDIAKIKRTIQAAREELAELERVDRRMADQYRVARDKAAAELAQARAEVAQAEQRRAAELCRAEIELKAAVDQETRKQKLMPSRAVTEAELIEAQTKTRDAEQKLKLARLPVDASKLAVLERAVELAEQDYAVRVAELQVRRVAKRGEIETNGKELANLELERERTVLRSPIDGVVVRGNPRVGDLVKAGSAVFEIARQQGFLFELDVRSEDLGRLREGMRAVVKFDAFDYQRYGTLAGRVSFISPDSSKPDEGSADRRVAYLVKIELDGDRVARNDLIGRVKLGMAGRGEIITDEESLLMILLRRIRASISLG